MKDRKVWQNGRGLIYRMSVILGQLELLNHWTKRSDFYRDLMTHHGKFKCKKEVKK